VILSNLVVPIVAVIVVEDNAAAVVVADVATVVGAAGDIN
jgi:hypothetical protein